MPLLTFDVGKLAGNDADREKKLRQFLPRKKPEGSGQDKPASDKTGRAEPRLRPLQPRGGTTARPCRTRQTVR